MFRLFKANVFLGQDELASVRKLRASGDLEQAEKILLNAEPSPAVADELRKIASTRASVAKKQGDWKAVIKHLESYNAYAQKAKSHCLKIANQEPPAHTATDTKLLMEAKRRLGA
jgi:hypothetical protein